MNVYDLSQEISDLYRSLRQGVVRVQQTGDNGEVRSEASGTLWIQAGIVLTVSHPFDDPDHIRVVHGADQPQQARVRGWDNSYDLAVLEVDATAVPMWRQWGELEALNPGELVFSLGFDEIRMGMVSRMIEQSLNRWGGVTKPWVEVDGVLSAAQAGGPLVNHVGSFVGINSPLPRPAGQTVGYGQLQNLVQLLLTRGNPQPAFLGVQTAVAQTGAGRKGLVITRVDDRSPAAAGGLLTGDVLLELAGVRLEHPRQLFMALRTMQPGDSPLFLVSRGREELKVTVTLGEQNG